MRTLWSRRDFLKTAGSWAGAGLLLPVLKLMGAGKCLAAAYPDEVLYIEKYTKGKVKPGMIISKENADLIKAICPEGLFQELKRGAEIKIAETDLNPDAMQPHYWNEATVRNQGQAVLDSKGQLYHKDGGTWIGGAPFPQAKTALEAIWNFKFNPRRLDDLSRASIDRSIDSNGKVVHELSNVYMQIQTVGRLVVPPPILPEFKDELHRTLLLILAPYDIYGMSVASTIYYDAAKLPDTDLYIPALRRTRRVPCSQRFDSAAPYAVYFTSDLDMQNDPVLTWKWELAGRKPMLMPSKDNLGARLQGSTRESFTWPDVGEKFPRTTWQLRPEMLLVDGTPTAQLEGAPYSKKRFYYDAVDNLTWVCDIWDLTGKLWKHIISFTGDTGVKDSTGKNVVDLTGQCYADLQRDYHSNISFFNKHKGMTYLANCGLKIEDWMTPSAMLKKGRR